MMYSLYLSFTKSFYNLQTGITSSWHGVTNYLNIARSQTLLPLFGAYIGKIVLAVPPNCGVRHYDCDANQSTGKR